MNSIENKTQSAVRIDAVVEAPRAVPRPPVYQEPVLEEVVAQVEEQEVVRKEESTGDKIKRSFFDRYVDKIKDFLDNAE
jgi:cell division protein FtsA